MRILSTFHDYYDTCLKFFAEENQHIIYNRKIIKENPNNTQFPLVKQFYNKYSPLLYLPNFKLSFEPIRFRTVTNKNEKRKYNDQRYLKNKHGSFFFFRSLIFFCGKIYPMYTVFWESYDFTKESQLHFYSFSEFDQYLKENDLDFDSNQGEKLCQQFFTVENSDIDFLIENKITIGRIAENTVSFNQKLSDYDFYKILDPYQAFQELNSWICGTLSYPQNVMLEVSNESKIEKAGFDKVWSFRKRPGKNK